MRYLPAVVVQYLPAVKRATVSIPGFTDGAEDYPEAELLFSIGDKSEHTDIRILPGDRVWVDFINDDPRFPIILGFRPKETDSVTGTRRWHHVNVEVTADTDMRLQATAGVLLIKAGTKVRIEAPPLEVDAATRFLQHIQFDAGIDGTGQANINGYKWDQRHIHGNVTNGAGQTDGVAP